MTRTILTVIAALTLTLPATAAARLAPPPAGPGEGTPEAVDWRLDEVGRTPRSLDLVAYGSSCIDGRVRPHVEELRDRVRIRVTADVGGVICTADYGAHPFSVTLERPLAGRAIGGPRKLATARDPVAPPVGRRTRVPRLLGLSPHDAAAVVRGHRLRPVITPVEDLPTRPRVVGQTPGSGKARRAGAAVTLFLSR
jgi:PASTA domain-containing protein